MVIEQNNGSRIGLNHIGLKHKSRVNIYMISVINVMDIINIIIIMGHQRL